MFTSVCYELIFYAAKWDKANKNLKTQKTGRERKVSHRKKSHQFPALFFQYYYFSLEFASKPNTVAAPTKVANPKLIAECLAASFLSFSSILANFDSSVRTTSPMEEEEEEVEGSGGVGCEKPSRGVVQANGDECCCCCCCC